MFLLGYHKGVELYATSFQGRDIRESCASLTNAVVRP